VRVDVAHSSWSAPGSTTENFLVSVQKIDDFSRGPAGTSVIYGCWHQHKIKRFSLSRARSRTEIIGTSRDKKSSTYTLTQISARSPPQPYFNSMYMHASSRAREAFWCAKSGSPSLSGWHRSMLATYRTVRTVHVPTIWDLIYIVQILVPSTLDQPPIKYIHIPS